MSVTILTVSVDYSDFLRLTLPAMQQFGHVVVATAYHDLATQAIAKENDAELVITDAWFRHNAAFAKAVGMNVALEQIRGKLDWLMLVDSDILLMPPPEGAPAIDDFNKDHFFGARRLSCLTEELWDACYANGDWYTRLEEIPQPEIRKMRNGGLLWGKYSTTNPYGVQGYVQLWNYRRHPRKLFEFPNAGTYDVRLALSFADEKRYLMPWDKYFVVHLGLPKTNWFGRVSRVWRVMPPDLEQLRRAAKAYYSAT